MKLPGKLNALVVSDLEARLRGVKGCLLVGYDGMPGADTAELRSRLRKASCRMRVVKNTLARVALDRSGLGMLSEHLHGTTALLHGEGEAVLTLSKVVAEWNKDKARKPVKVKAGLLDGAVLGSADVERLAAIPSRQVLLTQVARGMAAPMTGLAGALAGIPRKLARAVKAVAESRPAAAA